MSLNVTRLPRQTPRIKLGDRTRIVRREMNLTQEQFVEGLRAYLPTLGPKSYAAWEAGTNEPTDKAEVCEALELYTGLPREWFMGWADHSRPTPGGEGQTTDYGSDVLAFPTSEERAARKVA